MLVFHASSQIIRHPDTSHSREYLDFGPGFYLTTIRLQAEKYAEKMKNRGKPAFLNTYELSDVHSKWKVVRFDNYDEKWLDYVMKCRSGIVPDDNDIVIGGIADDKVFRTLDLYFAGDIGKEDALKRLAFNKPNMQICIRSQMAVNECLTFVQSEIL